MYEHALDYWANVDPSQQRFYYHRAVAQYTSKVFSSNQTVVASACITKRIAVILVGRLTCAREMMPLIRSLSVSADLFIISSDEIPEELAAISRYSGAYPSNWLIPNLTPSMYQWFNLAHGLDIVNSLEKKNLSRYTHILKIRADYCFFQPEQLLIDISDSYDFQCSSDKVFGGPRDMMMTFRSFPAFILAESFGQQRLYSPMDIHQVLCSDDSFKWYGFRFPRQLVGDIHSVDALREVLSLNRHDLWSQLLTWQPSSSATYLDYIELFKGATTFASEVMFARFLNKLSLPVCSRDSLLGFLRNDRK